MSTQFDKPKDYIESLPEERQKEFKKVRSLIRKSLPKGYKETIKYGMLNYEVPEEGSKKPPVSLSFASQKSYMAMYFSNIYQNDRGEKKFRSLYTENGYKINMGKSCLRFKSKEDLNTNFIEKLLAGKLDTPFR